MAVKASPDPKSPALVLGGDTGGGAQYSIQLGQSVKSQHGYIVSGGLLT
jgi:hypothetical protein